MGVVIEPDYQRQRRDKVIVPCECGASVEVNYEDWYADQSAWCQSGQHYFYISEDEWYINPHGVEWHEVHITMGRWDWIHRAMGLGPGSWVGFMHPDILGALLPRASSDPFYDALMSVVDTAQTLNVMVKWS